MQNVFLDPWPKDYMNLFHMKRNARSNKIAEQFWLMKMP